MHIYIAYGCIIIYKFKHFQYDTKQRAASLRQLIVFSEQRMRT